MKVAIKCIEFEIERQADVLSSGGMVDQETRLWDEAASATRAMRSKEHAQDYRYFPEPDLVEAHITQAWQEEIRRDLPELQEARRLRFIREYTLPEYDAAILTSSKPVAAYFEECLQIHRNPKAVSNWIMTALLRELNNREMEPDECPVTPRHLAAMIKMIDDNTISGTIAKQVFAAMLESGQMPDQIVREKGLVQITDENAIIEVVERILAENPDIVEGIRAGREKAMGFLVGQIMRATKGKANPQLVHKILKEKVGIP